MVLTALGAGLLEAGTSLAGKALGFASQERTNKQQMELAKYQNQWNFDMWNRQNEYNSPVKQMERLQEAGLNPNLIYGTGVQAAGNNSHASAAASTPTLGSYNDFGDLGMGSAVQSYQAQVQLNNQTKLAETQADLNAARTVSEQYDQALKNAEYYHKILRNSKDSELYPIYVEMERQNLENLRTLGNKMNVEINNLEISRNEMAARIDEIDSRIKVNEKTLDKIQSEIGLNRAQAYLAYNNAAKSIAETALINLRSEGQRLENDFNYDTFMTRVNSVSQDLIYKAYQNDLAGFEKYWKQNFGGTNDHVTAPVKMLFHEIRRTLGLKTQY